MSLNRNVSLFTGLRYKGQVSFSTYILHRIGGSALFIFFTMYILILAGAESFNVIFENWLFQIVILFCALFHAINGLRITISDLWPKLIEYQRQTLQVEWAVFALIYGFAVFVVIRNALGV